MRDYTYELTGANMVGRALSRLGFMLLLWWIVGWFMELGSFDWWFAIGVLIVGAAWDAWRADRPTDKRHFSVGEAELPVPTVSDPVTVSLLAFRRKTPVGKLAEAFQPDGVIGPFTMEIHHDLVVLKDGLGEVLVTCQNPPYRGGGRHCVGFTMTKKRDHDG